MISWPCTAAATIFYVSHAFTSFYIHELNSEHIETAASTRKKNDKTKIFSGIWLHTHCSARQQIKCAYGNKQEQMKTNETVHLFSSWLNEAEANSLESSRRESWNCIVLLDYDLSFCLMQREPFVFALLYAFALHAFAALNTDLHKAMAITNTILIYVWRLIGVVDGIRFSLFQTSINSYEVVWRNFEYFFDE